MFSQRYFGGRFFAARYWPKKSNVAPAVAQQRWRPDYAPNVWRPFDAANAWRPDTAPNAWRPTT